MGWFEFSAKILWVNCQWSGKQGQNAMETFDRWAGHGEQPQNKDVNVMAIRASSLGFHLDIPDDLGQVTYQLWATFPVCKVGIIIITVSLAGMPASRTHSAKHSELLARKLSSHYQPQWPWLAIPHNPDSKFLKWLPLLFWVCLATLIQWPVVPILPHGGHVYLH